MSLFESLKDTIAITIADAIGKYHKGFFSKRVLKTMEEVEANTNEKNLVSAVVVGELYNNLTALTDGGAITGMDAREDGVYITYVPSEGADPVTKKLGNSNHKFLKSYRYDHPLNGEELETDNKTSIIVLIYWHSSYGVTIENPTLENGNVEEILRADNIISLEGWKTSIRIYDWTLNSGKSIKFTGGKIIGSYLYNGVFYIFG